MKSKTHKINKKKNNTSKKKSSKLQKGGSQELVIAVTNYRISREKVEELEEYWNLLKHYLQ